MFRAFKVRITLVTMQHRWVVFSPAPNSLGDSAWQRACVGSSLAEKMKLAFAMLLFSLGEGRAAFAVTGRAAAPRRVVPMAFMPPPPPPPPSPEKAAVEETRTKYLDASAKKGIDSAQALAAMEEYKAALTSQYRVSPRTTPHAARASHTTPAAINLHLVACCRRRTAEATIA